MKEKERQLSFLLNLSDELRYLSDPSEVFETITFRVREYFDADICGYHEIKNGSVVEKWYIPEQNRYLVPKDYDWRRYKKLSQMIKEGKIIISNNTKNDNLLDYEFKEFCNVIGIRSFIIIPIIKEDNVVGVFFIDKDKSYKWIKSDIELAKDIAERTWMTVERVRDEKEKKLLFAKTIEEQKKLETIIENIDANVWITDTVGNITSLNLNDIEGLTLKTHEKSIYDLIKDLKIIQMDGRSISKEILPLIQAMKGEKTRWEEQIVDSKTGELRYREHRSSPIKNKYDEVISIVGITQDITKRKKTEQSLRESRDRGLELIRKLKEADELRTSFLSSLSHELRNPLATIMMGINLLQEIEYSKEIQEQTLEMMARQGEQLSRLVDDLLDMTRITRNKFKLNLETVELNKLIDNIAKDSYSWFEKKHITNEVNISEDKIHIKGDSIRLTQAIENLVHNASKFTPKHGKISIKLEKDYITNEAIVSIKDTGEGIAPKLLENIFEPFVQVKNNLGKSSSGLGIGLSIVKDIIKRHDGTIKVLSKGRGWGTEFIIRLPIIQTER